MFDSEMAVNVRDGIAVAGADKDLIYLVEENEVVHVLGCLGYYT